MAQDFLFDFTNNVSNLFLSKSETLQLSSLSITLKILVPPESLDLTTIYDKRVT